VIADVHKGREGFEEFYVVTMSVIEAQVAMKLRQLMLSLRHFAVIESEQRTKLLAGKVRGRLGCLRRCLGQGILEYLQRQSQTNEN
jgi:hypothetical protein